jgi:hypothetical protein
MASLNHSHREICRGSAPVPTPDATGAMGATRSGQPDRATRGGLPLRAILVIINLSIAFLNKM